MLRVALYREKDAEEAREDGMDLLDEARDVALARSAIYQQKLQKAHSRCIRPVSFCEGDLVLRLVQWTEGRHKLTPPWKGPFIITRVLSNNSYYLINAQEPKRNVKDTTDQETERPWNACLLRPFYS